MRIDFRKQKERTGDSGQAPGNRFSGVHGIEIAMQPVEKNAEEKESNPQTSQSRNLPLYSNREGRFPEQTKNPIKTSMEAFNAGISVYVVLACYRSPLTAASTLCAKYSMLLLFSPAIEMRPSMVM